MPDATTPTPAAAWSPEREQEISVAHRAVLKGVIANAVDGHREDPLLASHIADAVAGALGELGYAELDRLRARVAELEALWAAEPRATDGAVNALADAVQEYPSMGEAVAAAMAHNIRLAHAPEQPCAPHQFGGFTAACCVDCGHPLAADCHPKDGDHHA